VNLPLKEAEEVHAMRSIKVLGLLFILLTFLPAVLPAREYASTSGTVIIAYRGDRDDYYWRHRDRDDYWRHHRRRRWHRRHHRDRDDYYRHWDRDDYRR
jgi:hypothetical protein